FPLTAAEVTAATYSTLAAPVSVVSIASIPASSPTFPRGAAEDLVEALFAGIDGVRTAHPSARTITADRVAEGLPVPLHEGATLYYERAGPLRGPIKLTVMLWVYDISGI